VRLDIAFFRDWKMPSPSARSEGRLELDAVVRRAPRGVGRQRSCRPVERPLGRSECFDPGCCPRRGAEVCPLDRGQRGHSLCKRLELQGKKNGPNGIRSNPSRHAEIQRKFRRATVRNRHLLPRIVPSGHNCGSADKDGPRAAGVCRLNRVQPEPTVAPQRKESGS